MLRLHSYFPSSASYRVRIGLALKGLAYDTVPVDLQAKAQHAPAYRQLNPEGLVPLLEDGQTRVTQSMAILEYLDERFPQPALLPDDVAGRARVRALAQMIACDVHPLNNLRVLKYLVGPLGLSRDQKEAWAAHWMHTGLLAFEHRLAEVQTGAFCHGDAPGLADCFLVPQVANAQRMGLRLDEMPRVREIADRCNGLPAFQQAHPSACPDAPQAPSPRHSGGLNRA